MVIKVSGITVVDDNKKLIVNSLRYGDNTVQTSAVEKFGGAYTVANSATKLLKAFTNPNTVSSSPNTDNFGSAVAISNRLILVSASTETDPRTSSAGSGLVYAYSIETKDLLWTFRNPSTSTVTTNQYFGSALAVSSNYIAIRSQEVQSGSGMVYVYDANTFQPLYSVRSPDEALAFDATFGESVRITDDYLVISSYYYGGWSGRIYVYNIKTGTLKYTINNPGAYGTGSNDYFGNSLAISNQYIVAGAPGEDNGGNQSGTVYVFDISSGRRIATINDPNAYGSAISDEFGSAVAVSGDYGIFSAYAEDQSGGTNAGKVYIFNLKTSYLLYTLNDPNPVGTAGYDFFGYKMDAYGDYVVIGGGYESGIVGGATASHVGKIFVYNIKTGTLVYTIDNPTAYASAEDFFSQSLAVYGNYVIAGTPAETTAVGGMAYLFNITEQNNVNGISSKALLALAENRPLEKLATSLVNLNLKYVPNNLDKILSSYYETDSNGNKVEKLTYISPSGNITSVYGIKYLSITSTLKVRIVGAGGYSTISDALYAAADGDIVYITKNYNGIPTPSTQVISITTPSYTKVGFYIEPGILPSALTSITLGGLCYDDNTMTTGNEYGFTMILYGRVGIQLIGQGTGMPGSTDKVICFRDNSKLTYATGTSAGTPRLYGSSANDSLLAIGYYDDPNYYMFLNGGQNDDVIVNASLCSDTNGVGVVLSGSTNADIFMIAGGITASSGVSKTVINDLLYTVGDRIDYSLLKNTNGDAFTQAMHNGGSVDITDWGFSSDSLMTATHSYYVGQVITITPIGGASSIKVGGTTYTTATSVKVKVTNGYNYVTFVGLDDTSTVELIRQNMNAYANTQFTFYASSRTSYSGGDMTINLTNLVATRDGTVSTGTTLLNGSKLVVAMVTTSNYTNSLIYSGSGRTLDSIFGTTLIDSLISQKQ